VSRTPADPNAPKHPLAVVDQPVGRGHGEELGQIRGGSRHLDRDIVVRAAFGQPGDDGIVHLLAALEAPGDDVMLEPVHTQSRAGRRSYLLDRNDRYARV
jgi:hypothetical protein